MYFGGIIMIRRVIALLVSCVLLFSCAVYAAGESYPFVAFTTEALNLRKGPSTSAAVLLTIPAQDPVIVSGDSGSFYVVTYEGVQGYVLKEYVRASNEDGTRQINDYSSDYQLLSVDSRGESVSALQKALKELGYYTGSVDGKYGSGTAAAVSAFQQKNGLSATGMADEVTQHLLFEGNPLNAQGSASSVSVPAPLTNAALSQGKSGEEVIRLQNRLLVLGYYSGVVDGLYGSGTVAAVREFQAKNLLNDTGIADEATLTLLYSDRAVAKNAVVTLPTAVPTSAPTATPAPSSVTFPFTASTNTSVNLRKGKGTSYARIVTIPKNAKVTVLALDGNYLKVKYGQYTGYVVAQYVNVPEEIYHTVDPDSPDTARYTTLTTGSQGTAVVRLQNALKELGYYFQSSDGLYGSRTASAVKAFQKNNGLSQTGTADASTQYVLYEGNPRDASGQQSKTTPEPEQEYATLRLNDTGPEVYRLQNALHALGYYTGTPNSIYDRATVQAVKNFQKVYGLTSDGVAGPKTLRTLYAIDIPSPTSVPTGAPVTIYPVNTPITPDNVVTLYPGMSGIQVTNVQNRLKELGYFSGTVDGYYGQTTMDAVLQFQRDHRLTADGVAGYKTQSAMFESNVTAAPTATPTATLRPTATPKVTVQPHTTGSTSVTLSRGSTGTQVINLQKRLTELGYLSGADGQFGSQTYQAVIQFQKRNSLTADGIAGKKTLITLYSDSAIGKNSSVITPTPTATPKPTVTPVPTIGPDGFVPPRAAQVINVNWYTYIRSKARSMPDVVIYDPDTGLHYNLHMFSFGKHADSETPTAEDTAIMNQVCGINNWTAKAVWVMFPDGSVYIASTHSHGHEVDHTSGNDLEGHVCLHFPRVMSEAEATGPYAVSHQKAILAEWERIQNMLNTN